MKIAVVIPSRKNAQCLQAVLTALDHLASGQHVLTCHLVVDRDDASTMALQLDFTSELSITRHDGDPTISHFKRINEVGRALDVDAVTWFGDDAFPLAMHWDALIADGINSGAAAFAWQDLNDPENVTHPVLSRQWIDALGYVLPTYFPFWFVDTWLLEIHELAFGSPLPIALNLPVGGRRGQTKGMRDLEFWFRVFDATHVERQSDARRLARCWNSMIDEDRFAGTIREHHDKFFRQLDNIPAYEQIFGANNGKPSLRYCQLMTEAEQLLSPKE